MIPAIQEVNFPSYATLHQATVSLQEMGERNITTQVRIDGDIAPSFDGWELRFKGERFVLPHKDPQAAKDNTTRNSLVDLTFTSWVNEELKRYFFFEPTSVSAGTVIADKYNASVNLNIEDFIPLMNQVLDYYFDGKIVASLYMSGQGIYSTERSSIEINHAYLWDVLVKMFEVYGVRWRIVYNSTTDVYTIQFGYPADSIEDHDFEYGYQGGLLRFERQVQDAELKNILLGRGGEKNLPYRYFKKTDPENPEWAADPDAIPELANVYFDRLRDINFRWYVRGWVKNTHRNTSQDSGYTLPDYDDDDVPAAYLWAYQKGRYEDDHFNPVEYVKDDESIAEYGERWGALEDNDDIYPTIQGRSRVGLGRVDETVAVSEIVTDDIDAAAQNAAIERSIAPMTISLDGDVRTRFELRSEEFTVPEGSTGVIEYSPLEKATINSEYVRYDTENSVLVAVSTDDGTEYPFGSIPAGRYYLKLYLAIARNTSVASSATGTFGIEAIVLTTSAMDTEAWKPTFDIWVKNIWGTTQGQNETDAQYTERVWLPILGDRAGNEAKIVFSSGMMSISQDYEFTIVSYPVPDRTKTINGVSSEWKITLRKSDAELDATGLFIPNASTGGKPLAGDYFFFTGIDMPFQYVEWAEEELNAAKDAQLETETTISPTWIINLDKVRVHTLEDGEYGQTLADRLSAGATVWITDPRFTPGQRLKLYVQSITYTWNEPSDGNPYLVPDIEVVLSDKVVATEGVVSRMQNEVEAIKTQYAKTSDIEAAVRRVAEPIFLKKTGESDSSDSPTTFSSKITSKGFRQGGIGGTGWGIYRDNTDQLAEAPPPVTRGLRAAAIEPQTDQEGDAVIEVDKVIVRKEMQVNTLVINQIAYVGGKEIISAAKMEVSQVIENTNSYTVLFDQKQNSVANLFQVGDIAYGQRWSADESTTSYYKMVVTATDVNSITIGKSPKDGSGVPAKGDIIVQYGNTTNSARRYVIVRDVIGGGYERMLSGLNSVTATGNEYYFAGRQSGAYNNQPRWFVGNASGEYAEYKNGELNIKGRLVVLNDQGSYVAMDSYMNSVSQQFEEQQEQIDGQIESFEGDTAPLPQEVQGVVDYSTANAPASSWTNDTTRQKHIGDIFTDNSKGHLYRYTRQASGQRRYYWTLIQDSDLAEAISTANAARDRLNAWADDSKISPDEKRELKDEIARIDADYAEITQSYTARDLQTPTDYINAYNAYRGQLVTLSAATPETIDIPSTFATNQATYYTRRTACLMAVQNTIVAGYSYLREATNNGTTTVAGGLILSNLIALGKTENEQFSIWAGINGLRNTSERGNGIAAWYGGDIIDYEDLTPAQRLTQRYAKTLFRMDGSGYLAGGNISWQDDGDGHIPGISWETVGGVTSVTIDANVKLAQTGGTGSEVTDLVSAVQSFPSTYLTRATADTLYHPFGGDDGSGVKTFKIGGATFTFHPAVSGVSEAYIELDCALLTLGDQIVQSGTPGGGGGGGGVDHLYMLEDVYGNLTTQKVKRANGNDVVAGDVLTYDSSKGWLAAPPTGAVTSISVNGNSYSPSNGVVTLPNYPTTLPASDVSAWAKASTKPSYALSEISGTSDLQLIEALTGGGLLKRNSNNTWELDSNTYLTTGDAASTYQTIISDLGTIRSGASAGATAVQPGSVKTLALKVGTTTIDSGYNPLGSSNTTLTITAQNLYDAIGSSKYHPYGGSTTLTTFKVGGATFTFHPAVSGVSEAYIELDCALLTLGDQIVQSGTPGGGGGGGASNLYQLNDVSVDSRNNGDILYYNGSVWINKPASEVGGVTSVVGQTGAVTASQIGTALTDAGYELTDTTYSAGAGTTAVTNTTNRVWSAANLNSFISTQGYTKTAPYTLPLAASGTRGGIQIGYSSSGKNYAVQLSSEKAYVNVPWTDTTYDAGTGLSLSTSNVFSVNSQIRPVTAYNCDTGCLVKTDIADTATGNMILVTIEGNTWSTSVGSVFTQIQFYKNVTPTDNTAFGRPSVTHHGTAVGDVKAFCYDGYLYIWFSQASGSNTYFVTVRRRNDGLAINHATEITNAAVPSTGVTCLTNITTVYSHVPSSRTVNGKALSSNITLTLDDIGNGSTRSLANYLPLAGGEMTGDGSIIFSGSTSTVPLVRNYTGSASSGWTRNLVLFQVDGNAKFRIGAYGSYTVNAEDNGIAYAYIGVNGYTGVNLRFYPNSTLTFGDNTILHAGNYTSYTPILNSASTHTTSSTVIYAPTTAGTSGYWLKSNGSGAPTWESQANLTAGTVTTTSDTTNTLYVVGVTSSATSTLKRDTSVTVTGSALSAGTLTITNTSAVGHIAFSRESANYITAPTSGTFHFVPNGNTVSASGSRLTINNTEVRPGTNNGTIDLGTADYRWKGIYGTTGSFNGAVTVLQSSNSIGFRVTGTTYDLSFMIGSANVNRGIYSWDAGKWMLYFDATDTIANNGAFRPGTTNAHDLGTSTYRWKNIYAAGAASVDTLTITNTSAVGHIAFSRGSGNFFTAPSGGAFYFVPDGATAGTVGSRLTISSADVRPGNNNGTVDLGTSSYRWKGVYSSTLDTSGNASIGGNLTLTTNSSALAMTDSGGTARNVVNLTSTDNLHLGGGTSTAGYNTYLNGNVIYLRYGTSNTIGMIMNDAGNVSLHTSNSAGTSYRLYVYGNEAVYGHIYMIRNNYAIYMRNAAVPGETADDPNILDAGNRNVMTLTSGNVLRIGYGTYNLASAIPTNIYGTTLRFYTYNGSSSPTAFYASAAGNVGIGTATLTSGARLTVSGAIVSTGDQSISSDATLKTNLQPVNYTIEDIAKTRAVTFDWKDGRGHSAGSIAQDWKNLIPELVRGEEGNMTLAYGQIALINSILLAKHETEQDKEIKRLKARVKELETRLNIS